jgi:hypothetical protein
MAPSGDELGAVIVGQLRQRSIGASPPPAGGFGEEALRALNVEVAVEVRNGELERFAVKPEAASAAHHPVDDFLADASTEVPASREGGVHEQ